MPGPNTPYIKDQRLNAGSVFPGFTRFALVKGTTNLSASVPVRIDLRTEGLVAAAQGSRSLGDRGFVISSVGGATKTIEYYFGEDPAVTTCSGTNPVAERVTGQWTVNVADARHWYNNQGQGQTFAIYDVSNSNAVLLKGIGSTIGKVDGSPYTGSGPGTVLVKEVAKAADPTIAVAADVVGGWDGYTFTVGNGIVIPATISPVLVPPPTQPILYLISADTVAARVHQVW